MQHLQAKLLPHATPKDMFSRHIGHYYKCMILTKRLCEIIELSVKSHCLHPVFGPPFTSYALFQWYPQRNFIKSQYEMLKLSI